MFKDILLLTFTVYVIYQLVQFSVLFATLYLELRLAELNSGKNVSEISVFKFALAAIREMLYNNSRYLLYIPYKLNLIPETDSELDGTPILLVHGFSRHPTDWFWFKRQLANPAYTIELEPAKESIATLAACLDRKVRQICAERQTNKVILIGHSMGGLVSSYYAENLAEPGTVASVITLGSPLKGTKMAVFGCGRNVTEMLPDSDFLAQLREKISTSQIPYLHIATKMDNIVIPHTSSILDNGTNYCLEEATHLGLMYSDLVLTKVHEWLSGNEEPVLIENGT